jgi:membrane protein
METSSRSNSLSRARWLRGLPARIAREAWRRDRSAQGRLNAALTALVRIASWTVARVIRRSLPARAGSLVYQTVFALVPVLVVTLWGLAAFRLIPVLTNRLAPQSVEAFSGNKPLAEAGALILRAVEHAHDVKTGVVSIAVLLFSAGRLLASVDKRLDNSADAGSRRRLRARLTGYLLLGITMLLVIGVAIYLSTFAPGAAAVLSAGGVWIGLMMLYGLASRAVVPVWSAGIAAAAAAIALLLVLAGFSWFQIGVTRYGAVQSAFAAFPVFLLWLFSSWLVILAGGEVAVAHAMDRLMARGVVAWRLDFNGEQALSLLLAIRAARAAAEGGPPLEVGEIVADVRLPPKAVRRVAARLVERQVLVQAGRAGYVLACDPGEVRLRDVVGAVSRDPAAAEARRVLVAALGHPVAVQNGQAACAAGLDLTLRELVSRR